MPGAPHREIELKRLLVGEGASDRLVAALGADVGAGRRQVNHVLDTADGRLGAARYALRLRTEGRKAFLTAKGPTRRAGRSTGSKVEAEIALPPPEARAILAGRHDALAVLRRRLDDPAYAPLLDGMAKVRGRARIGARGAFENVRRTVRTTLPGGRPIVLELDRTRFPGGRVDEEIEIELPHEDAVREVEAWLARVTRAAGVRTRPASPKVVRFRAATRGAPS